MGLFSVIVTFGLETVASGWVAAIRAMLAATFDVEHPRLGLDAFVGVWLAVLVGAISACVLAAVLAGTLGSIDRSRTVRQVSTNFTLLPELVLVSLALLVLWALLSGRLAAAARSVDAPPVMLEQLWWTSLATTCARVGMLLVAIGMLHVYVQRWSIWKSLHQSVAEARSEASQS